MLEWGGLFFLYARSIHSNYTFISVRAGLLHFVFYSFWNSWKYVYKEKIWKTGIEWLNAYYMPGAVLATCIIIFNLHENMWANYSSWVIRLRKKLSNSYKFANLVSSSTVLLSQESVLSKGAWALSVKKNCLWYSKRVFPDCSSSAQRGCVYTGHGVLCFYQPLCALNLTSTQQSQ